MQKARFLLWLTLLVSLLVFILLGGMYLALTDIHREYASTAVLRSLDVSLSKELPALTATAGEWGIVQVGMPVLFGFLVLNGFTLIVSLKKL